MLRQYQAQFRLQNCPVVLVYSAVAAASAVSLTQQSTAATIHLSARLDQRLRFLFKSLDECADTHNFAAEARRRLEKSLQGSHDAIATGEQDGPSASRAGETWGHDQAWASDPTEYPGMDWFYSGAFNFGSPESQEFTGTTFGYDPL